jgi:hypothetical protein
VNLVEVDVDVELDVDVDVGPPMKVMAISSSVCNKYMAVNGLMD